MIIGGFARQFSWTAGGRILAAVVNLMALVVFSRVLGPAEYGKFALGQAGAIMLYSVIFHWLAASITRMSAAQGDDLPGFRGAVLIGYLLASVVTLGITGATIVLSQWIGFEDIRVLAFAAAIAAISEALTYRSLENFRAFSRSESYASVLVARATCSLGFAWAGFHLIGATAEVALFGHAAGCLVTAIGAEVLRFESSKIDEKWRQHLGKMLGYGGPLSTALIFRIAIGRFDRFVIGYFFGQEAVGYYALAFDFASRALGLPLMIVNTVTYPMIVNAWESDQRKELKETAEFNWNILVFLGVPAVAGLALISGDVLRIIFGQEYAVGYSSVILSIAACYMFAEAIRLYHLDIPFMLTRLTKIQILICSGGFSINVIACLLIIPHYGVIGAAIAAMGTILVMALLAFVMGRRHYPIPVPVSPILKSVGCTIPMGVALWMLGDAADSVALSAHIVVACLIYLGTVLVLNVQNARTLVFGRLKQMQSGS